VRKAIAQLASAKHRFLHFYRLNLMKKSHCFVANVVKPKLRIWNQCRSGTSKYLYIIKNIDHPKTRETKTKNVNFVTL